MASIPDPRSPILDPITKFVGMSDLLDAAGTKKLMTDLRCQARKRVRRGEIDDLVSEVLLGLVEAVHRMGIARRTVTNVGGLAFEILVRRAPRVIARRARSERQLPAAAAESIPAPEPPADESLPQALRMAKLPRMGRRQRVLLAALQGGASMDAAAALAGLPRKESDRVVRNLATRIARKTEI